MADDDTPGINPFDLLKSLQEGINNIRKKKGLPVEAPSVTEIRSVGDIQKILLEAEESIPTAPRPAPKDVADLLSAFKRKTFVPGQCVKVKIEFHSWYRHPLMGESMYVTEMLYPPVVDCDGGRVHTTDVVCAFYYEQGAEIHLLELGFDSRHLELVNREKADGEGVDEEA